MTDVLNLEKRLSPNHLLPDTEDGLKKEVTEKKSGIEEAVTEKDPRNEKEYTFNLNYEDGNGKIWSGEFTNCILNIRGWQLVGITRSRLAGGQPFESMDSLTSEINLMVSHLTQSLKKRPEWAKDLLSLDGYDALYAIYWEVDSHESHFHGRKSVKEISEAKSG